MRGIWDVQSLKVAGPCAILIVALAMPAHAADLLRCNAVDSVSATDQGTLTDTSGEAKFGMTMYEEFIIDLTTGAMRQPYGGTKSWVLMQQGDGGNDWVYSPTQTSADTGLEFVRIRDWASQSVITFIAFSLSTLITGTCHPVD
jgi:hypothetical protein